MPKANMKTRAGYTYDAVARLLARTLIVPEVFFEAAWPNSNRHVDVLAIDRAGSGDLHVVEVKSVAKDVSAAVIRKVAATPGHYRWIATTVDELSEQSRTALTRKLINEGIGLIGVPAAGDREMNATVVSKPIRSIFDRTMVGDFLKSTVPDIEYGEAPQAKTEAALLSKGRIRRYLEEADALLSSGHERAAFLLAWSATEAAMKLTLRDAGQSPMLSATVLVGTLADSAGITINEAQSLRNALRVRNALAHGLDDPPDANKAYKNVTVIARRLLDRQRAQGRRSA